MTMKMELPEKLPKTTLAQILPKIHFPDEPDIENLYDFAWQCAYNHIRCCDNVPQSPFMDEAFALDRIWIWDTCFMALYCKYAPEIFPGIASLQNFYVPMLDNRTTALKIHIPDNPPLFAWAEWENYRLTGNRERLEEVFFEKQYPQRMFELFENFKHGQKFTYMSSKDPVQWEKQALGYHWSGGRCGMDNTPRGNFGLDVMDNNELYRSIYFLDAAAQQALSAKIIFDVTGEAKFKAKYEKLALMINEHYWDNDDGCYYDISSTSPHELVKVLTPASFWPLLAGIANQEQAVRLAKFALQPDKLGGEFPFPSVSRDSSEFTADGCYWRGGVWLPTAYMSIKALEQYNMFELADELAEKVIRHQLKTWLEFSPHTIWEAYSPTSASPATGKRTGEYARPEFCGWSALGPICLMIENFLGIQADCVNHIINWHLHHSKPHGVEDFRFGNHKINLFYDGNNEINIKSDDQFTLIVKGQSYIINSGKSSFHIDL